MHWNSIPCEEVDALYPANSNRHTEDHPVIGISANDGKPGVFGCFAGSIDGSNEDNINSVKEKMQTFDP